MIKIKLNETEYKRILRALKKLQNRAKWWFEVDGGEMNRRCAIGYAQLLIKNIMTEKYAAGYAPYHPRYRQFKQDYFSQGWWRLKGDLVKNVVNFKEGIGWMGGVPAGVFDTGGKSWFGMGKRGKPKSIAMYARVGEFGGKLPRGGGDHPARPVFRPTMEEFERTSWPKQIEYATDDIKRAWR